MKEKFLEFYKTVNGKIAIFGGAGILIFAIIVFAMVFARNHAYDTANNMDDYYATEESIVKRDKVANGGAKIVLGDSYDKAEVTDREYTIEELQKMRDEQIAKLLEENGLTATDLANYEDDIEKELRDQIKELREYYEKQISEIKVINGKDGKDGKDGKQGKAGVAGARGQTGIQGKQGIEGKGATVSTNSDGDVKIEGSNGTATLRSGKSTYIFYAEDANGTNATLTPNSHSKYMQSVTALDEQAATEKLSETSWTKFKDSTVTYDPSTNTISIITD